MKKEGGKRREETKSEIKKYTKQKNTSNKKNTSKKEY